MRANRHRRQIVLFLLAIVAPAAVLIGLGARLVRQERELAVTRAARQRLAAVEHVRRELAARLDALRLEEINRLIRPSPPQTSRASGGTAVVFAAALEGESLVMPWERPTSQPGPDFARHLQRGESQELLAKDFGAAAAEYRLAIGSARSPSEVANATLHLARTLARDLKTAGASRLYRTLLNDPSGARDEEGVRYRLYAAQQMLEAQIDSEAVLAVLRDEASNPSRLTLPELYVIHPLLGGLRADLSSRIEELEQSRTLAKDLARVRAQIDAGAEWVPYGPEPWLVTVTSAQPGLAPLVIAVSSGDVAPPGVRLVAHAAEEEGEALGTAFPGLRVEWLADPFQEAAGAGPPTALWVAGLALVLGMALFGGYLLLRDVNRDVRITEVRAQFVAGVSHELKTPLTAIRMFAETLALGRSRDERAKSEYLETIVNESERLTRLVDNVLDFSKIEQGKKIYRLQPTRLDEVAGSAVRAMRFPLAQQGFTLHIAIEDGLPEVLADGDALQQAILNLLANAMKYSGDSRDIELRLHAHNGDAVIEVADRGLGLAPEEQEHVFDKFYRAPSHESRLIAGTGLGLTLVDHIARAHRGRVGVVSEPGHGSTFSVSIPIATPSEARS